MTATREGNAPLTGNRPGLVLTAVGPDRKGLIQDIAAHVRRVGGNIEDTRMSRLGGEFAVLVLVTGDDSVVSALKESLPQMESAWGVSCFAKDTSAGPVSHTDATHVFKVSGMDHTGIVDSMTRVLADRGVNVNSFSSWIENAPLTGTPLFLLEAKVEVADGIDLDDLHRGLTEACERENVEYSLTPVTSP